MCDIPQAEAQLYFPYPNLSVLWVEEFALSC